MIIKYKPRMTSALILKVFFTVLVSSFASPSRALGRISAVLGPSNSSVFGIERVRELSLQITESGDYAFDIVVFQDRTTSSKVNIGNAPPLNHIVTVQSQDEIVKWLSKNKPQIILCFAQDAGLHYTIGNARKNGLLSSDVKIISVLEDVTNYQKKYEQGNANLEQIATVFIYSDLIVFTAAKDQKFLEKELKNGKLDIPNKALLQKVKSGIVLQHFSLIKDYVLPHPRDTTGGNEVWIKQNRIRRDAPNQNKTLGDSNTTMVAYPTPSSTATLLVGASQRVHLNMTYPTASSNVTVAASSPTVHPNMTYPTASSNATVATFSPTIHPNMTYPTASSNATAMLGASQTVNPNMTYPMPSSNATVASSSTLTVYPNMTYPTSSSNATVVASSPTVYPNMTYPTLSSNATVVASSPTVSPNMTYPTPASNATVVASSPTVYPNMTYPTPSANATVVASSLTVYPNMTYPTLSANATVVASSPTVSPNMTYPTLSANATVAASSTLTVYPNMTYPTPASNATVVATSPTVSPNMTYPTLSSNATVVASSPTVSPNMTYPTPSSNAIVVGASPTVSPNMTYKTPSSNATAVVGTSQTVHPNMTYPTPSSNATVAASSPTVYPNITYTTASSNATVVASSPTVHPNMTYPTPSINATVVASSPTVSPNMTYKTPSSNATAMVGASQTIHPNMTYPMPSSNATVASSSAPTVYPNMTYPTASSNATVVASSPTVHPNMTYPTASSNATVVASSPTVHPNITYPTASSNATVVASSLTVYPNMTYPTSSSTVSLLFQTKSLTINQTSSVEQPVVSSSTPLSVMATVSFLYNQSSVRQTPSTTVVPFSSPPTLSTTVSLVISGQSSSVVHPLNATVVVSTSTAPLTSSVVYYFNETVILKTQAVTSLPSVYSTTSRQRMSSTFSPQATSTLLLSSSLSSTGFLSITEMATPSLSSVQITTPSSQAVLPQVTSSVVLLTSSPTGLLSTEEATPSPSSVQIVIPTSSIITVFTPSKDDERYLITFEGNCKDVVENDEKKNKFREEFTRVITDILEITDKEIQVEEVKCGSINVTFIVKNAKNRNTTVVLRKAVSEGNFIIRVDGTAYTSSGLVVIPSPEPTKPSTGVRPTTKPDNKLALYLYITFGAVMGMIFLIGLIILIIRCRREKTRGTFTLGSDADVELKRFKGIPRASYYRVEMYGEPVEVDAARAGVCEDEYDGNIVPYAQTSFNSNTAAHSSNKANKDEFTMGNLPEWNVPKLRATDVVVSSPQRTSAAEQSDGEVPRDENANNDALHAYENPVMTFGETSNNSSE